MKKIILSVFLLVGIIFPIVAQYRCHSAIDIARLNKIYSQLNTTQRNYNGGQPMVRLCLNRITKSDGSGGFSWAEIDSWVNTLPEVFASHGICFAIAGKRTIKSNEYYGIKKLGDADNIELINSHVSDDAIDIYFIENGEGGLATGFLFTGSITRPTVTIGRYVNSFNALNTYILAHEVGHCLGLLHTHETAICNENIPTSGGIWGGGVAPNCTTCGDLLCDTDPDPGLDISTANVNDATCVYIGGATQNGTPYTPNTRNIMSYTLPHCMLSFTWGQGNRMRNYIYNTGVMDNYIIPADKIMTGTLIWASSFPTTRTYAVEKTLTLSDNPSNPFAVLQGDYSFQAGISITMKPGFYVSTANSYPCRFVAEIKNYSCLATPIMQNSAKRAETVTTIDGNIHTYRPIESEQLHLAVYPTILEDENILHIASNQEVGV